MGKPMIIRSNMKIHNNKMKQIILPKKQTAFPDKKLMFKITTHTR